MVALLRRPRGQKRLIARGPQGGGGLGSIAGPRALRGATCPLSRTPTTMDPAEGGVAGPPDGPIPGAPGRRLLPRLGSRDGATVFPARCELALASAVELQTLPAVEADAAQPLASQCHSTRVRKREQLLVMRPPSARAASPVDVASSYSQLAMAACDTATASHAPQRRPRSRSVGTDGTAQRRRSPEPAPRALFASTRLRKGRLAPIDYQRAAEACRVALLGGDPSQGHWNLY